MAVTQILCYPKHKTLMVVHTAGDGMNEWLDDLIAAFDQFAKGMGCKFIEEYGRKGWQKTLQKRGWSPVYTVMRKEVNG